MVEVLWGCTLYTAFEPGCMSAGTAYFVARTVAMQQAHGSRR